MRFTPRYCFGRWSSPPLCVVGSSLHMLAEQLNHVVRDWALARYCLEHWCHSCVVVVVAEALQQHEHESSSVWLACHVSERVHLSVSCMWSHWWHASSCSCVADWRTHLCGWPSGVRGRQCCCATASLGVSCPQMAHLTLFGSSALGHPRSSWFPEQCPHRGALGHRAAKCPSMEHRRHVLSFVRCFGDSARMLM